MDTFFCIPDSGCKNALEIYGSKGSILATGTIGQGGAGEMTAYIEEDQNAYEASQSRGGHAGIPVDPGSINTYRTEISEFSQAILCHRAPHQATPPVQDGV